MKQRMLVAKDNSLNSELLGDWLEAEGSDVLIASELNAVFAAVRTQHPNAVLLSMRIRCPGKTDDRKIQVLACQAM